MTERADPFEVVIVGGGVAALEAALALRDLAGGRVATTLLAAEPQFVYRPLVVREPFGYSQADHYPLDELVLDAGAELIADQLAWLDLAKHIVHTEQGRELRYDALLLAHGARMHRQFSHAVTLDYRQLDEQLHGLVQDVESGYVRSLAFLISEPTPWPLPIYELALMTAGRAYDVDEALSVVLVTPEDAPLAVFGGAVSEGVERILGERGIEVITSAHANVSSAGHVSIHPGDRTVKADRIVALPRLAGPPTPGLPNKGRDGFIAVDPHGKVRGCDNVFAAGDATDFPVKHGGIAAQQADVAAQAIAAMAGVELEPERFHPVLTGVLLGAAKPLLIRAHITGGHGSSSEITELDPSQSVVKIDAKYLGPFLEERNRAAGRTS